MTLQIEQAKHPLVFITEAARQEFLSLAAEERNAGKVFRLAFAGFG